MPIYVKFRYQHNCLSDTRLLPTVLLASTNHCCLSLHRLWNLADSKRKTKSKSEGRGVTYFAPVGERGEREKVQWRSERRHDAAGPKVNQGKCGAVESFSWYSRENSVALQSNGKILCDSGIISLVRIRVRYLVGIVNVSLGH